MEKLFKDKVCVITGETQGIGKSIATQFAQDGVIVYVCDLQKGKVDSRISRIAIGRLGIPDDVANACSFLASDRSSYISGQILGVDGCASI